MLSERSEEDVFHEAWSHARSGVVAPVGLADASQVGAVETPVAAVVETPQKIGRNKKREAGGELKEAGSGDMLRKNVSKKVTIKA